MSTYRTFAGHYTTFSAFGPKSAPKLFTVRAETEYEAEKKATEYLRMRYSEVWVEVEMAEDFPE